MPRTSGRRPIGSWPKSSGVGALDRDLHCNRLRASQRARAADRGNIHLSYHGLDLARFGVFAGQRSSRDGSGPTAPSWCSASVAPWRRRATTSLLKALALLPADLHWRFEPYRRRGVASAGWARWRPSSASPIASRGRVGWRRTTCWRITGSPTIFALACRIHVRRRPRRAAQRARRGVEPGPGLRFRPMISGVPELLDGWRQRVCGAARGSCGAGGGTRRAIARPGTEAAPRRGGRAKSAVRLRPPQQHPPADPPVRARMADLAMSGQRGSLLCPASAWHRPLARASRVAGALAEDGFAVTVVTRRHGGSGISGAGKSTRDVADRGRCRSEGFSELDRRAGKPIDDAYKSAPPRHADRDPRQTRQARRRGDRGLSVRPPAACASSCCRCSTPSRR